MPSGRAVILPARGNQAIPGRREEDRGGLKIFDYADGQLTDKQSVAPNGGREFRCRHVEFHPSGRWVYVVIESQNELHTFGIEDDRLSAEPLFVTNLLAPGTRSQPGQAASAIRMHPTNGRTLYVANRGRGKEVFQGEEVIAEGMENSIAVLCRGSRDRRAAVDPICGSAEPRRPDVRVAPRRSLARGHEPRVRRTDKTAQGKQRRDRAAANRSVLDRARRPIDVSIQAGRADRRPVSAVVWGRSVLRSCGART